MVSLYALSHLHPLHRQSLLHPLHPLHRQSLLSLIGLMTRVSFTRSPHYPKASSGVRQSPLAILWCSMYADLKRRHCIHLKLLKESTRIDTSSTFANSWRKGVIYRFGTRWVRVMQHELLLYHVLAILFVWLSRAVCTRKWRRCTLVVVWLSRAVCTQWRRCTLVVVWLSRAVCTQWRRCTLV